MVATAMAIGILIDQLGTYLVLSTLGIAIASIYSAGANSAGEILKRVFTFPPLLAWRCRHWPAQTIGSI